MPNLLSCIVKSCLQESTECSANSVNTKCKTTADNPMKTVREQHRETRFQNKCEITKQWMLNVVQNESSCQSPPVSYFFRACRTTPVNETRQAVSSTTFRSEQHRQRGKGQYTKISLRTRKTVYIKPPIYSQRKQMHLHCAYSGA